MVIHHVLDYTLVVAYVSPYPRTTPDTADTIRIREAFRIQIQKAPKGPLKGAPSRRAKRGGRLAGARRPVGRSLAGNH